MPSSQPPPSPGGSVFDLLPFLTSGVTVYNLGDTTLYVVASGIDSGTNKSYSLGKFQVEPEQFTRQATIPLRIRFDFSFTSGTPGALGSCTIDVGDADEIDFVAVNGGAVVTRNNVEPDAIAEMNVATSSLCKAGAAQ